MKIADEEYTLSVLKMVVNADLDNTISTSIQDLASLESNRDQIVWKIATRIYTHSGHKIELPIVRDLVDARIRDLKRQLAQPQNPHEQIQQKVSTATEVESARVIFIKICSIICRCTEISSSRVSMDSRIGELANKQELAKIWVNLEAVFDIHIPEQAAAELQTVKHAVDFIANRQMMKRRQKSQPLSKALVSLALK
ncbi:hypothetical protein [Acaryochloris sp. IP29b_bin.148]|uniref:hypothetical protein n=1 Tax=Acaryochloris sp. IP29b_bin.148 TaxID=2969218 RepID=UPI00261F2159|nr:hypothetical protein [Acaryochloris sp. IP29b_bin.148]